MLHWVRTGLVLAVAMALIPSGQAQIDNPDESTPTTLYFHIWDTFNKFVVNTQPYNSSFFDTGGVNFATIEQLGESFNTVYGYSTAGPVEYDFIEAGRPRLHPERGIAQDVVIDEGVQPVVYLYIDLRDAFGGWGAPSVMPEMTFRVTMREGDDPGSDLNAGNVIMQGQQTAYLFDGRFCASGAAYWSSLLSGPPCHTEWVDPHAAGGYGPFPQEARDGTPILYPDEANVIELAIPMEVSSPLIPKSEAYNIRIDWYQEFGGLCGEDECAQGNLRLVLDEDHLPRLEMNILNPVYIEFIHPQVAAGTLLIHTGVNSPWGTYDIDPETIRLTVDGPMQPANLQQVVARNQHVHGLHDKAAEITYLWDFRDEGAPEGDYAIRMEVSNAAATATAVGNAGFTVQGKEAFGVADTGEIVEESALVGNESQGSPAVGVLAVVALLAVAIGRRWRA